MITRFCYLDQNCQIKNEQIRCISKKGRREKKYQSQSLIFYPTSPIRITDSYYPFQGRCEFLHETTLLPAYILQLFLLLQSFPYKFNYHNLISLCESLFSVGQYLPYFLVFRLFIFFIFFSSRFRI
jgi:hypothetical protein